MKQILAQTEGAAGGVPPPVEQGADLQRMANQSSAAERRAMEAERDVVDLYRAHFMRDKIGEEYEEHDQRHRWRSACSSASTSRSSKAW